MSETKENFLQRTLMPAAVKMQNNLYVSSIMQGMMSTMPVLMGGAILQLFYSLPITPWTNLLTNCGLYGLLTTVVDLFNLTAIYIVFGIGRVLGGKKGADGVQSGVISLLCFLIMIPLGEDAAGNTVIVTSYLGAKAVIAGMLTAMIAASIFAWVVRKNWVLKMPESVPDFVANSFTVIPPAVITVLPFIALRGILSLTSYGNVTDFIYAVLQAPLTSVGNSLGGHLVLLVVCCLLWWCGVHGTMVIYSMLLALMTAPMLANIAAVNAGEPAPYLLSFITFFMVVQFFGGPGCMFGLYIDMAFLTKSERYKAQGKISLIPGLFNIIEPTVYGLPVCLNPVLLAPFVGLPVVVYLLLYAGLSIGLFTTPVVNIAVMVMPGAIVGFLMGGGIGLGIFCLFVCVLSIVVYYPFVKLMDNQALAEEKAAMEAQGQE